MISGRVNAFREAVVQIPVRSSDGREQTIEVVIDTGFNGHLTLPPHLIEAFGLPFRRNSRAVLGDGSTITFDVHEALILWGGRQRRIPVDSADTEPLLGMSLLDGHELNVQVIPNGEALIKPLSIS
ncbi:MAG TPA: clan AA aspartic protease [Thermoanaerobaculia bacterium]|jgi:clan AA aspartic protease|nr:clan AA aspartic protease [Thermoanaerobaculia bacterium]